MESKHRFRPVINKEAVIAYVAKYASKGETASLSYEDTLQKAIKNLQNTDHAGIAYQKMLSSFAAEREISSQETCHILYSLSLIWSSRKCQHLDLTMDKTSDHVNFESSRLAACIWIIFFWVGSFFDHGFKPLSGPSRCS